MTMKMYLRPFLKMEVVAASGATITFLYFSVHIGHRLGDRRGVRAHHHVHLVLGDELLVQALAGGGSGLVVIDDQIDLAAEQPALVVRLLHAQLIPFLLVVPGLA